VVVAASVGAVDIVRQSYGGRGVQDCGAERPRADRGG
jgi:hypothetical protein